VDLLFLNGPVGGGLVALASALAVFGLTQRHQRELEILKDARALRDARRERLRASYEQTLLVTRGVRDAIRDFPQTGEPRPLNDAFLKAIEDVNLVRVRLTLEGEKRLLLNLNAAFMPTPWSEIPRLSQSERDKLVSEIDAHNAELEAAMVASLLALEQPIRSLP
jgi:hypothetical protein